MSSRTAVVSGFNIAWSEEGAGETVLLVHGVTTASFIWDSVVSRLSTRFRTVAVDLLGCGASDRPAGADYSIRSQARLLAELVERTGGAPVHVVGHDAGGGVAQIMAVRSPGLVRDLTLINTIGYDYWPVQPIISLRTPFLRQLAMATLDLGILKILIRRALYHQERLSPELLENCRLQTSAEGARKAFLHFVKSLNNADLMEISSALRELKVPVLIIRGEADVYLSSEISDRLHREIPGSRLVRIPTAGHFAQIDEPELIEEAMTSFFKRRTGD
jgi:pimeloyl-ACP methyl ester carboxylesterase